MLFPQPPSPSQTLITPKRAILSLRIIWAALLMGQLSFAAVMAFILSQSPPHPLPPDSLRVFLIVATALLVTSVPMTYFVRSAIFRHNQTNGLIAPAAYSTGSIIFWAGCEAPSFFGLIIAFLHSSFYPTAIAIAAQISAFPRLSAIQAPDESFKID